MSTPIKIGTTKELPADLKADPFSDGFIKVGKRYYAVSGSCRIAGEDPQETVVGLCDRNTNDVAFVDPDAGKFYVKNKTGTFDVYQADSGDYSISERFEMAWRCDSLTRWSYKPTEAMNDEDLWNFYSSASKCSALEPREKKTIFSSFTPQQLLKIALNENGEAGEEDRLAVAKLLMDQDSPFTTYAMFTIARDKNISQDIRMKAYHAMEKHHLGFNSHFTANDLLAITQNVDSFHGARYSAEDKLFELKGGDSEFLFSMIRNEDLPYGALSEAFERLAKLKGDDGKFLMSIVRDETVVDGVRYKAAERLHKIDLPLCIEALLLIINDEKHDWQEKSKEDAFEKLIDLKYGDNDFLLTLVLDAKVVSWGADMAFKALDYKKIDVELLLSLIRERNNNGHDSNDAYSSLLFLKRNDGKFLLSVLRDVTLPNRMRTLAWEHYRVCGYYERMDPETLLSITHDNDLPNDLRIYAGSWLVSYTHLDIQSLLWFVLNPEFLSDIRRSALYDIDDVKKDDGNFLLSFVCNQDIDQETRYFVAHYLKDRHSPFAVDALLLIAQDGKIDKRFRSGAYQDFIDLKPSDDKTLFSIVRDRGIDQKVRVAAANYLKDINSPLAKDAMFLIVLGEEFDEDVRDDAHKILRDSLDVSESEMIHSFQEKKWADGYASCQPDKFNDYNSESPLLDEKYSEPIGYTAIRHLDELGGYVEGYFRHVGDMLNEAFGSLKENNSQNTETTPLSIVQNEEIDIDQRRKAAMRLKELKSPYAEDAMLAIAQINGTSDEWRYDMILQSIAFDPDMSHIRPLVEGLAEIAGNDMVKVVESFLDRHDIKPLRRILVWERIDRYAGEDEVIKNKISELSSISSNSALGLKVYSFR